MRFPSLQNGLRNILSNEMEKVVREEKFLKDEPDRLESALRRCKKLTGTLVTLKRSVSYCFSIQIDRTLNSKFFFRLASVQEQRLPCNEPPTDDIPRSADLPATNKVILLFLFKFCFYLLMYNKIIRLIQIMISILNFHFKGSFEVECFLIDGILFCIFFFNFN